MGHNSGKGSCQAEEEVLLSFVACGTLEAAERYWQAKQSDALAFSEVCVTDLNWVSSHAVEGIFQRSPFHRSTPSIEDTESED